MEPLTQEPLELFEIIAAELMPLITAHLRYEDCVALRSTCRAGRAAIRPPSGIRLSGRFSGRHQNNAFHPFLATDDYNTPARVGERGGAYDHDAAAGGAAMPAPARDLARGLHIVGGVLPARVASMRLSICWSDQGWGNRKGAVQMSLLSSSGSTGTSCQSTRVFGIAPHAVAEEIVDLTAGSSPLIAAARPGDRIEFSAKIGGGGGHSLEIRAFRCAVVWADAT